MLTRAQLPQTQHSTTAGTRDLPLSKAPPRRNVTNLHSKCESEPDPAPALEPAGDIAVTATRLR
jgi:hypothetical protein